MRRRLVLVLLPLWLLLAPVAQTEQKPEFQIIVHASNPAGSIQADNLSAYLLKKERLWPHGEAVRPVDQGRESNVREAFSEAVHGRSVSTIDTYWQRQVFSGREIPPPKLANSNDVVAFVAANRGGVGYVLKGTRLEGVKTISVVY